MKQMLEEILGSLRQTLGVDVTKKDATFLDRAKDVCLIVIAYIGVFLGWIFNTIVSVCKSAREFWKEDPVVE